MAIIPFPTDSRFLEKVRNAVLQYARKHYGSSGLSLEDLTQDAMLTLFENVCGDKLTKLTSSIKTYAIGIFENKAKEALRKQAKFATLPQQLTQDDDEEFGPVDIGIAQEALNRWLDKDIEEEHEQLLDAMYDIVTNMQDPCKTILWAFYWEDKSMREIAEEMAYNTTDVAKSQSSRCKTKVKAAMEETFKRLRS